MPTPDGDAAAGATKSAVSPTAPPLDPPQASPSPASIVEAPASGSADPLAANAAPIAPQSPPEPLGDPLRSLSLSSASGANGAQPEELEEGELPPTPKAQPVKLGTLQSMHAPKVVEPQPEEAQIEEQEEDDDEEAFVYPGTADDAEEEEQQAEPEPAPLVSEPEAPAPAPAAPAVELPPIDYAALAQLATNAPLSFLQAFFTRVSLQGHSSFALANEPSPSSGLVPLHYAAREGRADVVRWLVEEAGAMVELEDREGEVSC